MILASISGSQEHKKFRFSLRALGKEGVFDDIFLYFSSKPYVVTSHMNRLVEAVQMSGHNICFYAELT